MPKISPRGVGILLSALLLVGFSFLPFRPTVAASDRVITVYYDGKEETVVTDAPTVGEVLKRAEVNVGPSDLVEPGMGTFLVAQSYNINVYRARPVTVVDGTERLTIITPHSSARQIAQDAGIELHPEDLTETSRIDDFLAENGVGLKLTIDRAAQINMVLYGNSQQVRTQATTVGEFIQEKGVVLGSQDGTSMPLDASITEGMNLEIWRNGVQTVTVEEEVGFRTEFIHDTDKPMGYKEVVERGVKGKKLVTYEIELRNGTEVSRKQIQGVEIEKPQQQLEIVGAKGQYTTPSENENITWSYLIEHGFSRVQTAGIMGNLQQEHRFNTSGDGIAQWTGARRAALYAKPNPNNIYTQLDFLMEELNGKYVAVRDAIKADGSSDPANVVRIFQNRFEKCGVCMEDRRIQYARNILVSH